MKMGKTARIKYGCVAGSFLLTATLLTSCALLPKEASERQVLIVNTVEQEDYELVMVKRDNVVSSQTIYCTYSRLSGEELSFVTEGLTVWKVNVTVGDKVKKGDLIAELSMGKISDEIAKLNISIKTDELKLESTSRILQLELEKLKVQKDEGDLTTDDYNRMVTETKATYKKMLQVYEDALYINRLKVEDLDKQLRNGRIYAGSDGTVSYIKPDLLGSISTASVPSITISSSDDCAFIATTEFADYFIDGGYVDITTSSGTVYETIVKHDPNQENTILFTLVYPDFELKVDTKATATLIQQEAKDVMTLPSQVILKGDGFHYVYLRNSDGLKSMKEIEIGLSGNGVTQIVSGLSLGDVVIKK